MIVFLFCLNACEPEPYTIKTSADLQSNGPADTTQTETEITDSGDDSTVCVDPPGSETMSYYDLDGRFECGQEIYLGTCSICHGANGEGGNAGRQLSGVIANYTDEYLAYAIVEGEGTMPPQSLSPQQTADIIAYLRDTM